MMDYNKELLARRWALNCAVAFFSNVEAASTESVLEVAESFRRFLIAE